MANLTYSYVYFASGPHTRQPRSSSGPGGFTLIQTLQGGTLSAGDTFAPTPQSPTRPVNGVTYDFAFVSVSGGTGGGVVSTDAAVPPPAVTVGANPIVVLFVYGPPSGTGQPGGENGATIDSFDIATGVLFNDTFVTVVADPSHTLTNSGNVDGWVPSASAPLTIDALSPTTPTGVDFSYWLTFPDSTSTSPSLAVSHNENVAALAFYNKPPVHTPPPLTPCQQAVQFLQQIIDDGDRPRLTVAQFNAVKTQLEDCIHEGKLTQAEVNELLDAYEGDLNPPSVPVPVH